MTFIIVRVKVSSKLNKNINIQTRQVLKQNGEKQRFEFTTKGSWQQKFADFIRYEEQIEDAKVNVTIKIEDSGVKLIRKGDINMNLHFVEGHETTTLYDVPTGKIPLTVKTLSLMISLLIMAVNLKYIMSYIKMNKRWVLINMK